MLDVSPYTEPLSRTPAILRAVIEGRPDVWLDSRHAPDVKSPRKAVVHLAYCERESFVTRARYILDPDFVGPDDLAEHEAALLAMTMPELLDDFEAHRAQSLTDLADLRLTTQDLQKQRTDEIGTQTVGNLLATWVAHDLYHLGQIFKSFSALYLDQIGPYQQFLNLPHFN
jgi:uncharacterized damage-inducible protein DinB